MTTTIDNTQLFDEIEIQMSDDAVSTRPPYFPEVTTAPIDWYIDGASGSDSTGDGTAGNPFQSFTVLDNLPTIRRYPITIRPAAGTYTAFPAELNIDHLILDASGEDYTILESSLDVATVTRISGALSGDYLETDLVVSGSPGWTPLEFCGGFIRVTSGNWTGAILSIISNGSDSVRVGFDAYGFQAGDTFEIVDVPVKINIDHGVRFLGGSKDSTYTPRSVFAGIEFNCTDNSIYIPFVLNNVDLTAVFCRFKFISDGFLGFVHAFDSYLNSNYIGATLDNPLINEFYSYALQLVPMDGATPTGGNGAYDLFLDSCNLGSGICCRRGIHIAAGVVNVWAAVCTGITVSDGAALWVDLVVLDDVDALGLIPGVELVNAAHAELESVFMRGTAQAISVGYGSTCKTTWVQGVDVVADYAAHVGPAGSVYKTSANTTIVGAVGAIQFNTTGATAAAWPTGGASETDSLGSFIYSD